jgi:signal transduction histidine kinase
MRKLVICFFLPFLLLLQLQTFSQDKPLEKLMALPNDTVKVQRLIEYTKSIAHSDPRQHQQMSSTILQLSQQLKWDEGVASAYALLGYRDITDGNDERSIGYYKQAINYYTRCNNVIGIAKCTGNIANAYAGMSKEDSSIYYRLKAIAMLENMPAVAETNGQRLSLLSMQYYGIATGYYNVLNLRDKALPYYQKAEAMARQVKDTLMMVSTLTEISTAYLIQKKPKEASDATLEALRLSKAANDNLLLTKAYEAYAEVLRVKGLVNEAVDAGRLAVQYANKAGSMEAYLVASYTLGETLKVKGDVKGQISVMEAALKQAKASGQLLFAQEIFEALAEAHYRIGNYKAAFDYLKEDGRTKDSIYKEENNRFVVESEKKYEAEKKERLLSQHQLKLAQNEVQLRKSKEINLYSIGAVLCLLAITGIVILFYRNKRRLHGQQLQVLKQEKELHLLQAVMQGEEKERGRIAKDLHDGVAGLLSAVKLQLNALSLKFAEPAISREYTQAVILLDEAHEEVRKTSHNLMPEVLFKYGLNEALRRYCGAISTAALPVHYHSLGDIANYTSHFELAVYRVAQELLGNMIKHAKATEAQVQLSVHEGLMMLEVQDNGQGFAAAASLTSIGLQSLQARVQSLNGQVSFESTNKGLTVMVELDTQPFIKQQPACEPVQEEG